MADELTEEEKEHATRQFAMLPADQQAWVLSRSPLDWMGECAERLGSLDACQGHLKAVQLEAAALIAALRMNMEYCRDHCRGTGIKRGGNNSGDPCTWKPCIKARELVGALSECDTGDDEDDA